MCYMPELQLSVWTFLCVSLVCPWWGEKQSNNKKKKTPLPSPSARMCLMAGLKKFSHLKDPPKHRETLLIQHSQLRTSEAGNCQLKGSQGCPTIKYRNFKELNKACIFLHLYSSIFPSIRISYKYQLKWSKRHSSKLRFGYWYHCIYLE